MSFRGGNKINPGIRHKGLLKAGLSALAMLCLAPVAEAGVWRAVPSLELAETWTDNVDLDTVEREYDFITRITPGINVQGQGGRLNMFLDYKANFLIFARDDENTDLRHQLRSSLDSELKEDWIYLDARASINQQFLERGGSISRNDENVTDNRRTVQTYSISPSLRRPLGTFANVVALYRASYVRVGDPQTSVVVPVADLLDNTLTNQFRTEMNSGRRFTRFNWTVSADYATYNRTGGRRSTDRLTFLADGGYRVNSWLRLESLVGYEDIEDTSLFTQPSGFIWNVGATLTPGPRTRLTVRAGRRYERENWSVRGLYKLSARTNFSLTYVEEITTTLSILQDQLLEDPVDPLEPDAILDPGTGTLVDAAFRRKRLSATLSGSRKRNSFGITGFYEERERGLAVPAEDNYGGNGYFRRQLSPYTSVFLGGTYQHTKFDDIINRSDDFYSGQVGLTYTISQYLDGGVTYFYTNRKSSFDLRDIKENAVRVNLRARF